MGTTKTRVKPEVSKRIDIEEAFFLLRTAMWDQADFKEYIECHEVDSYEAGYCDGKEYASNSEMGYEREWQNGYDQGYDEGYKAGCDEGYSDGYADGSNEGSGYARRR